LGEDNENYEFNVVSSMNGEIYSPYWVPPGDSLDFGDIGLNDMSIEMWFRYFPDGDPIFRTPAGLFYPNGILCGYFSTFSGANSFGLGFDGMNASCTFGYGNFPPDPVYQITGAAPQDGDWHHWCMTCDRSGFMNFYIDGRVVGAAVDISPEVAVNIGLVSRYRDVGFNSHSPDGIAPARGLGLTGAAAFHTSVLTDAQIRASVFGRTTQFLPTTQGAWNFNVYTILSPENLGFMDAETFLDHRPNGWPRAVHRPTGLALPLPCIVVHDLSGSGRDMGLYTAHLNYYVSLDPSWK